MNHFARLFKSVSVHAFFQLTCLAFSVSAQSVASQYGQKRSEQPLNFNSAVQDDELKKSNKEGEVVSKVTASDHGEASIPPSKGKNETGTDVYYGVQFGTLPTLTFESVNSEQIEIANQAIDHFTIKNNSSARLRIKWKAETTETIVSRPLKKRNLALRRMGQEFPKVEASFTFEHDSADEAVDGIINFESEPSNRWTCHTSPNSEDWFEIDFGQKSSIDSVELGVFDDGRGVKTPARYSVEYWDGRTWQLTTTENHALDKSPIGGEMTVIQLTAVTTKKLRVTMIHQPKARSGLTEIRVWGTGPETPNSSFFVADPSYDTRDIVGKWRHFAGNSETGIIQLDENGQVDSDKSGSNRWSVRGSNLLLNWPSDNASKGYWLDSCRLVADNALYIGTNQRGVSIHGIRMFEDGKNQIEIDKIVGGSSGLAFGEIADEGWFLTGIKVATERFRDKQTIATIVPVYGNLTGDARVGATFGSRKESSATMGCKPDFRVATIEVYHDQFIRGLRLNLVSLENPDKTHLTSLWGTDGHVEKTILGRHRAIIVGICGRYGSVIDAIGVIESDKK